MNVEKKDRIEQFRKKQKLERESLFSTCILVDGTLYSFLSFKNIPIMGDLNTGTITLLGDLVDYDPTFSADSMLNTKDTIFALELNGKRLMKWSIKDKKCRYFNIDCDRADWGNYAAFSCYGKYLYIFPTYADGIVKIDLEEERVEKDKSLYQKIRAYQTSKNQREEDTYVWRGCQAKNVVWLFQKQGRLAVAYDMITDTWKEYELSVEMKDCEHVVHYMDKLYLLSATGKVYCWDRVDESIEEIANCSSKNINNIEFARIAVTDKRIFVLPALGNEIYCIDANTRQVEKYNSYPKDFRYCAPEMWGKYYGYCEDDEHYYFAMRSMNYILVLDKRDGEEKWIKPKLPFYEGFCSKFMKYHKYMFTETEFGLESILTYLQKNSLDNQSKDWPVVGKKVWEQLERA